MAGGHAERLAQYRELARQRRQVLRINLEIDVGLHRGGLPDEAALREVIGLLQGEPWLQWSGLMGYDAHTEKIPDVGGLRAEVRAQVQQRYRSCLDTVQASPLARDRALLTLNTGGSPTYRLHRAVGAANEVAVGSALVKPSDFDTPLLADLQPAVFDCRASARGGSLWRAPRRVGGLGTLLRGWAPQSAGGPFSSTGALVGAARLAGGPARQRPDRGLVQPAASTLGSGPPGPAARRPRLLSSTQSESVLQQFGDIAVVEGEPRRGDVAGLPRARLSGSRPQSGVHTCASVTTAISGRSCACGASSSRLKRACSQATPITVTPGWRPGSGRNSRHHSPGGSPRA